MAQMDKDVTAIPGMLTIFLKESIGNEILLLMSILMNTLENMCSTYLAHYCLNPGCDAAE